MMSFSFFVHFIWCEFFLLWIIKSYSLNAVCVRFFECSKTFSTFSRHIKCIRIRSILTFCSTCSITRSIYMRKISNNSFFFDFRSIIVKIFLKCDDWIFSLMYLSKKEWIYSMTTRANCRNVLLMISLISNALFKLILCMTFITSRRVIDVSSSIDEK